MVTRTFIDKSNTIVQNSIENFGLNPISVLCYGKTVSRALIHFDLSKVQNMVNDGTYSNQNNIRHILHMKNCGSLTDERRFKEKVPFADENGLRDRATSFDIIAFTIPNEWDEGIGFDHGSDFWMTGKSAVSKNGCTWYQYKNYLDWETPGIYSTDVLAKEYQKYSQIQLSISGDTSGETSGITSVIIARQHFDHGNEDIEMDLTEYINSILYSTTGITGNTIENFGICLAFSPLLEAQDTQYTQYVGFFNNKTNTIFEPYIETRYTSNIHDDRLKFYLGKENQLCLYTNIGGTLENLDNLPKCTIDDVEFPVIQLSKGVYAAKVKLDETKYKPNQVLYDIWSDMTYNGEVIDDVDLDFATHSKNKYFNVGTTIQTPKILNPILSGIDDNEKLLQTDIRTIKVSFREPYKHNDYELIDNAEYRLYTKDGNREVDIIDWDEILTMNYYNYFLIDTTELIPQEYHIDIKASFGKTFRTFKDVLKFKIVNDVTFLKM